MFNLLKKKQVGEQVTFTISGMHCVSCSMNIDGELEDLPGVTSAETSYAAGKSVVIFDSQKVSSEKIKSVIESLGYTAVKSNSSSH